MKGFIVIIASILVFASTAKADTPPRDFREVVSELRKEKKETVTPSATGMVQGLLLCLGVFFVGVFIAKKFRGVQGLPASERSMRVLERLHIGGKSHLLLVEISGKRLLLSSTGEQVSLISSLEGVHPKRLRMRKEVPAPASFAEALSAEGGKS